MYITSPMPTDADPTLPEPRLSLLAAFAGLALFLVIALAVTKSPSPVAVDLKAVPEADRWKYTAEGRAKHLADLRTREQQLSGAYQWIDKDKGVVRLPIEKAMEIVLRDASAGRTR